ncbi:WRKY transcription factor [Ancistrocladus abbreviatus]
MNGSDLKNDTDDAAPAVGSNGATGAKYKLMSPAKLPISRSPCLTIPPGLSPTSFLESPVLLSNIKAEPSPTTGSLCMTMMHGSTMFSSVINSSNDMDGSKSDGFEFKPHVGSNSSSGLPMGGSLASADMNHRQTEQVAFHLHPVGSSAAVSSEVAASSSALNLSATVHMVTSDSGIPAEADTDKPTQKGQLNREVQLPQPDHKGTDPPIIIERTSEDGYNWRKYGQKLVKGSEFPRSYYKCTHPNCEVKKLFERSPDGQITEIIYKGTHDHPKPQPSRRISSGSMMSIQEERSEKFSPFTCQEDKPTSASGHIAHESSIAPELSPGVANDNSMEGGVSPSTGNHDDVADDDDPFAKRRKMDIGLADINSIVKPIREPRVVVQTLSEVDILDDGYRWRKYGQKVVRGNPNPRSYYKCTSAGCPVRKHVERASHDPKAVITTYEGKHNHDVPSAKTSSHDTATATAASLTSRIIPQDAEMVSLDLGVGINSPADNLPNQHAEALPRQAHSSSPNFLLVQAAPISTFPGFVNGAVMLYGSSRENHVAGQGIANQPLIHPANPYQQSMGRILLGP